jgi:Na+-transporting NADH:ubiquinone oxidoreductase subunit NqrF
MAAAKISKRERVKHVRLHAGVQIKNKVMTSVDEKIHGAVMWEHPHGVEVELNGDRAVLPIGNIYSYYLYPKEEVSE